MCHHPSQGSSCFRLCSSAVRARIRADCAAKRRQWVYCNAMRTLIACVLSACRFMDIYHGKLWYLDALLLTGVGLCAHPGAERTHLHITFHAGYTLAPNSMVYRLCKSSIVVGRVVSNKRRRWSRAGEPFDLSASQSMYLYKVLNTSITPVRLRPRLIVLELHHSLQ